MKNDTVEQITPRSASKSVLPATGRQDSGSFMVRVITVWLEFKWIMDS